MEVRAAVRFYRRGAGLRREDLAHEAKVSYDTICAIEQGRTIPSLLTTAALARALGKTIDELVYFKPGDHGEESEAPITRSPSSLRQLEVA